MSRFESGWIKLHRSLVFGDIGGNPICLAIFVRILAWAVLKPTTVRFNGEPLEISRGTVVIGVRELAQSVGCASQTAYRHLKYLEKRDTIQRRVGKEGTLITIVNFERYQGSGQPTVHNRDADETVGEREVERDPDPIEQDKKRRSKTQVTDGSPELWKYYEERLQARGVSAIHEGAKTTTLCDRLVKAHGFDQAKAMVAAYVDDDSPFVREKSWPLGLLASQQQQYLNKRKASVAKRPLTFGEEE